MPTIRTTLIRSFLILISVLTGSGTCVADAVANVDQATVRSHFETHCFGCHGDGAEEGNFSFDKLIAGGYGDKTLDRWEAVWKNIRAETMPPPNEEQPHPSDRKKWATWIQSDVFRLDSNRIDPGQVVLRRLNRPEYRETIQQLLEFDFKAIEDFPADDTGYGFDTIGEVLHMSPVLMEKYLAAAEDIVSQVVPVDGPTPPETRQWSNEFHEQSVDGPKLRKIDFSKQRSVHMQSDAKHAGRFRVEVKWELLDAWTNTKQHADAHLYWHKSDGSTQRLDSTEIGFLLNTKGLLTGEVTIDAGPVHLSVDFRPTSNDAKTTLADHKNPVPYFFDLQYFDLIGPVDNPELQAYRTGKQILVGGPPPAAADEQKLDDMTVACIRQFGRKAFRRPVEQATVERLAAIARRVRSEPGNRYEHGVAEVARLMLASPRFLFRVEGTLPE